MTTVSHNFLTSSRTPHQELVLCIKLYYGSKMYLAINVMINWRCNLYLDIVERIIN